MNHSGAVLELLYNQIAEWLFCIILRINFVSQDFAIHCIVSWLLIHMYTDSCHISLGCKLAHLAAYNH